MPLTDEQIDASLEKAASMWPQLLDLSREDCKRVLRRLELEAYSSVISAFRAHGDLTKDKKKILGDLQHILSISTERHRAEVRRAVNDEKLTTIADSVSGPNISSEWLIEGRRLIPLMPRLVPQTAFTGLANSAAGAQAEKNAAMVPPHATSTKEIMTLGPASTGATTPTGVAPALPGHPAPPPHGGGPVIRAHPHNHPPRPSSPNSNIVVLPSGMSIRIEGGLNTDEDEMATETTTTMRAPSQGKKRRRSSSSYSQQQNENLPLTMTPPATRHTIMPPFGHQAASNPMKITFAKSPQKSNVSAVSPAAQKVILVSSASGPTPIASVLHKPSMSPIGAASTTTTSAADQPKTSIILPQTSLALTSTPPTDPSAGHQHHHAPQHTPPPFPNTMGKVRPRMVHRGRPSMHQGQRPGMVVPMSPGGQTPGQVQMRAAKPTIQVKHEGGMKIITHAVGSKMSGTKSSPVMTRPVSGSQMVVVSNASSIAMVTKSTTGVTGSAGLTRKVVNVSSQGAKLLTTTRGGTSPNVVTVNPKTLQITAVKSSTGNKPNVIVVQKAQPKHGQRLTTTTTLDKVPDLVSFLQKEGKGERYQLATAQTGSLPSVVRLEKKTHVVNKPQLVDLGGKKFQIRTTDGDLSKSSVLAEIIQQANLASEAATAAANVQVEHQQVAGEGTSQQQGQALNEWVDYDVVTDEHVVRASTSQQEEDEYQDPSVQAIKSLLKLQQGPAAQQTTRINLKQLSTQIGEGQFFNLDQASTILPQPRQKVVTQTGNTVQFIQTPGGQTRAVTTPGGQEVLGELDPQTGLFYPAEGKKDFGPILSLVDKAGKGGQSIDIFSSALAEAQIDLDPYQFMEEHEPEVDVRAADVEQASRALAAQAEETESGAPQFAVLPSKGSSSPFSTREELARTVVLGPRKRVVQETVEESSPQHAATVVTQPVTISALPASVAEHHTTTTYITTSQPSSTSPYITLQHLHQTDDSSTTVAMVTEPSSSERVSVDGQQSAVAAVSVAVQPTGMDASLMNLDDFTSQRLDESAGSGALVVYDESGAPLGKRKRRPPAALDDSPPHTIVTGSWIRGAMNLIQRVSKYRGANREKGQINAAAWFLHPVNAQEAPDYYQVIDQPMDFSTIRRKLESGLYTNLDEFHQDMCLIRQNCHKYNPPQHQVRRDCDEVFHYYIAEYEKLVDRLKAGPSGNTTPPVKKLKMIGPP